MPYGIPCFILDKRTHPQIQEVLESIVSIAAGGFMEQSSALVVATIGFRPQLHKVLESIGCIGILKVKICAYSMK
jgi:hypothetical protein